QESHGARGVQQRGHDRYAQVFAESTADGGHRKRDGGSDRQPDRTGKLSRETHIGIVARSDVHSAEYRLRLFKHGEIRPQALQDLADSLRQGTLQLGQPRFGDVRLDLWREGSRERLYLGLQIRHLPAFGSESAQSWGDTFVIELLTHEGADLS